MVHLLGQNPSSENGKNDKKFNKHLELETSLKRLTYSACSQSKYSCLA